MGKVYGPHYYSHIRLMIDQSRIRRAFNRAAADFNSNDFLHGEVRGRLLGRLLAIVTEPTWIVDLGAGTGGATAGLKARFPDAQILSVDSSSAMLVAGKTLEHAICADAASLPLADGCVDLVISNLMLHHCPDPGTVLSEARRVLSDRGLLMFTTFGHTSLIELGRAWATADQFTHIAPFFAMQDLGDLLATNGFAEPVLDTQTITVTYDNLARLLQDLRHAGSINATEGRQRGLTGRGPWQRLAAAYDQLRGPDGKLPVTLEIIFGLAWAGTRAGTGGDIEIPVEAIGIRR